MSKVPTPDCRSRGQASLKPRPWLSVCGHDIHFKRIGAAWRCDIDDVNELERPLPPRLINHKLWHGHRLSYRLKNRTPSPDNKWICSKQTWRSLKPTYWQKETRKPAGLKTSFLVLMRAGAADDTSLCVIISRIMPVLSTQSPALQYEKEGLFKEGIMINWVVMTTGLLGAVSYDSSQRTDKTEDRAHLQSSHTDKMKLN